MVPSIVLKSLYFYELQFQTYFNWHLAKFSPLIDRNYVGSVLE
jgi:hypothetical protein